MSPDQRIEALRDGEAAAAFYEQHPFEQTRQSIIAAWTRAVTTEAREACWFELAALDRVVGKLTSVAQNAKVAAVEIKQDEALLIRKDPYVP